MFNRRLEVAREKKQQIPRNQGRKEFAKFSSSGKRRAGLGLVGLAGTVSIIAKATEAKAENTETQETMGQKEVQNSKFDESLWPDALIVVTVLVGAGGAFLPNSFFHKLFGGSKENYRESLDELNAEQFEIMDFTGKRQLTREDREQIKQIVDWHEDHSDLD